MNTFTLLLFWVLLILLCCGFVFSIWFTNLLQPLAIIIGINLGLILCSLIAVAFIGERNGTTKGK